MLFNFFPLVLISSVFVCLFVFIKTLKKKVILYFGHSKVTAISSFPLFNKAIFFLWVFSPNVFIHNIVLSSANVYEGDICHHRVTRPVCWVLFPTPPTLENT